MIESGRLGAFVLLILILVSLWVVGTRLRVSADLGVFMPEATAPIEKLLLTQLEKGPTSRLVFVGLSGKDSQTLAETNKALAASLRRSGLFVSVNNGEGKLSQADRDLVLSYRYLLTPADLEQRFTVGGLRKSLQARLQDLASPLAPLQKRYLPVDPTGELQELLDLWTGSGVKRAGPQRHYGVWFSEDRQRTLLVLEAKPAGFDVDGQIEMVGTVQRALQDIAAPGVGITLTGPSVFAVETRDTLRAEVRMLAVVAVVCVGLFLYIVFRSLSLLLLVLVPLVLGVAVATAAVLLVFGSIHVVTMAFGVTLIGVAVDYPIHVFSQLKRDASDVRQHVSKIWPTLRLGVVTTAIAYASLIVSDFEGLKQVGVFTVAGLLSAAAVTRWLLPLIFPRAVVVHNGVAGVHRWLQQAGQAAPRARVWSAIALVLAAIYMIATDKPLRDFDVDSLSTIPTARRLEDRALRHDTQMWSGGKLLAVVAPTAEQALQHSERLLKQLEGLLAEGVITDFNAAAQYMPSAATQRARQARLPAAAQLAGLLERAMVGLTFKPGIFEPFLRDVETARTQPQLTPDKLTSSTLGSRLNSLLFESDEHWIAPILLHGVRNPEPLSALTGQVDGVQTYYLDLKGESTRIMGEVIDRVMVLLACGGAVIYLVLAVSFRSMWMPLRILGPTLAAVLAVSACLVFSNIPLTLFHLVSLLLVIGLGLDYALFYNRLVLNRHEWSSTFRALWVCCVTTVLVFGALLLSQTPPLHAVGVTVALGAAFCLIFGAIWSSAAPRLGTHKSVGEDVAVDVN